ncbi:hypothetical protein RRG08_008102 [Elysia crispata]|uniref:Uncharacterized protein n=1 Tax=Elysia crispata TaxID=231223 RepID=A0AAE0YC14_9GAST|nr:hypothetical protein RRG08_008102 [Elysia crispata]
MSYHCTLYKGRQHLSLVGQQCGVKVASVSSRCPHAAVHDFRLCDAPRYVVITSICYHSSISVLYHTSIMPALVQGFYDAESSRRRVNHDPRSSLNRSDGVLYRSTH